MKLAYVAFEHPVPLPPTQNRIASFSAAAGIGENKGWDITVSDDGVWLRRGETSFFTQTRIAAAVPMKAATPKGK